MSYTFPYLSLIHSKLQSKIFSVIFIIALIVRIMLGFLQNNSINEFKQLILLTCFLLFFILYKYKFYKFSAELKTKQRFIFQQNILEHSFLKGKVINELSLINNKQQYSNITPPELKESYKLTVRIFTLSVLSFSLNILIIIIESSVR